MNQTESVNLFKQANAKVDDFGAELPNDEYYMRIDACEIATSKKGNKMVKMTYEVLEGDFAGKKHSTYSVLDNEVAISILFTTWRKLGLDTSTIEAVEHIQEFCDYIVESNFHCDVAISSKVVKGKEYTNTKIVAVVDPSDGEDAVEGADPEPTEEATTQEASPIPEEPEASVDDDEEDEEEEETQLEVGMTVQVSSKGKKVTGKITEIDFEKQGLTVVSNKTGKEYKVPLSNVLQIVE